jgi:2'-phosphotransferase
MRAASEILIYIDVDKAISAGVKFFLSANGVVLTEGDSRGFLDPQFFYRVENAKRVPLPGWEGTTE